MPSPYRPYIQGPAHTYNLDALFIEAMVDVESTHRADAFRFEEGFWLKYLKDNPLYMNEIPRRVSASYGLMQVMYPTAREHGYEGTPEGLFLVDVNLHFGCKIYRAFLNWADGDKFKAVAGYNGGKGNWTGVAPQRHMNKVKKTYEALTR